MAEVMPSDILLRIGGRTLQRYGVLAVAGAGRGRVEELKETFTRGSTLAFRDQDGIGRKAAIDKVAIEYPGELSGLVDSAGLPFCGPRLNGARTQLVTDPENFGAWTVIETPVLTSGQADPFGTTAAYTLADNDAAASEEIVQNVTFTVDATKAIALFVKKHTPPATHAYIATEQTAPSQAFRGLWRLTWDVNNAPVIVKEQGSAASIYLGSEAFGNGWYRLLFAVGDVVAANTNRFRIIPTNVNNPSETGTLFIFGANAWNAPFPSSYQGPSGGASPSVASLLTLPFNWGTSRDLSVLTRVARPVWVAASGDIGGDKYVWELSTTVAKLALHGKTATRDWRSIIDTSVTDSTVDTAIPAGAELRVLSQFKTLVAGGQVAQDVGSGLSGFGGAASAAAAYGNQTLRIGGGVGTEFDGVLLDALFVDGQHTKAELEAVE